MLLAVASVRTCEVIRPGNESNTVLDNEVGSIVDFNTTLNYSCLPGYGQSGGNVTRSCVIEINTRMGASLNGSPLYCQSKIMASGRK